MHLATMSCLFLLLIMVLPSAIFFILEPQWTLLDAFYFVFISLTTIGLGDYIPGDNEMQEPYRDIYKSCVGLFLLLGLVFMSLTLTVFYDIPQLNLGLHLHRHRLEGENLIFSKEDTLSTLSTFYPIMRGKHTACLVRRGVVVTVW